MCPGPNPEIIAITPICEIVAALVSRRGVVRHLIGWKSGRLAHLLRYVIKVRRQVRPRYSKLPAPTEIEEGSLRLDGKLIEREMAVRHRQRFSEFRAPFGFGLPRPRINQIEAHSIKIFDCNGERFPCLGRGMKPSEEAQLLIREGLHPDRNAVDA